MVVRMRSTRAHRDNRRAHHALRPSALSKCAKCGRAVLPHRVCLNCGTFRGREFINVLAKLSKKQKEAKEKDLAGKSKK